MSKIDPPLVRPRISLKNTYEKTQFIDHIYVNIEELKQRLYDKPIKPTFPPSFSPPPLPPRSSAGSNSLIFSNYISLNEESKNSNNFNDQRCFIQSFPYQKADLPPPLPPRLYQKTLNSFSRNQSDSTLKKENILNSSSINSFSKTHPHLNLLSRSNTLPTRTNHKIESKKTCNCCINSTRQKFSSSFSSNECKSLIPCLKSDLNDISGFLYKIGPNRKNFNLKWCILTLDKLIYFEEKPSFKNTIKSDLKKVIDLENILYLSQSSQTPFTKISQNLIQQKSSPSKKNDEFQNQFLYCFDIGINSSESRVYQFAASNQDELQNWFVNIVLRIEPKFGSSIINYENIKFAGYMHLKIGISGSWTTCWLILKNRQIIIISELKSIISYQDLLKIDLRKVMEISYSSSYQINSCAALQEKCQPIYLNRSNNTVIYIQGDYKSYTDAFFSILIKLWTIPINGNFEDQLLTSSNVPIAVEKCLNFICTYGGLTCKDIYSKSGDEVLINNLLLKLKNNKVLDLHISAENGYTVYDVTSTLKKYLQSFPQSLYTDKLLKNWISNDSIKNREKRLSNIKNLLKMLPKVNFATLKKLLCHFCCVIENSQKNKMNLLNLAPIIGPTLFYSYSFDDNIEEHVSINIFIDLVTGYSWLFDVTSEEMEKEREIQRTLTCLRESKIKSHGLGGNLLLGVYIHNREQGACLNVPLNPNTTAQELIEYIYSKTNIKEPIDTLSVYEVVCDNQFERFLHYSEVVLSVILSWTTYWPAQDAKTNYLIVKKNDSYSKLEPFLLLNSSNQSSILFNELKFSDINWGKCFKKLLFKFIGAKLTIYKDAKSAKTIGQWNIEDIIWYFGSETKRGAPNPKFCLTFIEKNSLILRNKENNHLIGRVVCCNNEQEYYKWIAGMIIAQYPNGLKPIKPILNLLD